MINNRSIVHMDLDTFFVSCERLLDSRLNNKPILIGGTSDRGVVASCSYETRLFGIHSGMPMLAVMAWRRGLHLLIKPCLAPNFNCSLFSCHTTNICTSLLISYHNMSIDVFFKPSVTSDTIHLSAVTWPFDEKLI